MADMRIVVLISCIFSTFVSCSNVQSFRALTPEEGVCTSDEECGEDECCVAQNRRRFLFDHTTSGICRTIRYQGFACHVFHTEDSLTHLHLGYCPCADGLECRGTSVDSTNTSSVIHHDPKCLPIEER